MHPRKQYVCNDRERRQLLLSSTLAGGICSVQLGSLVTVTRQSENVAQVRQLIFPWSSQWGFLGRPDRFILMLSY